MTLIGQDSAETADLLQLREEGFSSLSQEVTKLTAALQEYQLLVQVRFQLQALLAGTGCVQRVQRVHLLRRVLLWLLLPASAGRSQADGGVSHRPAWRSEAGAEEEAEGEEGGGAGLAQQQGRLEDAGGEAAGQPGQEGQAH